MRRSYCRPFCNVGRSKTRVFLQYRRTIRRGAEMRNAPRLKPLTTPGSSPGCRFTCGLGHGVPTGLSGLVPTLFVEEAGRDTTRAGRFQVGGVHDKLGFGSLRSQQGHGALVLLLARGAPRIGLGGQSGHRNTTSGKTMPVVIEGTLMERGPIRWRAVTSGLQGAGPADKTLVIRSDTAALPGLHGTMLNIAEFREGCSMSRQEWVPAEGKYQCKVVPGTQFQITVSFAD